MATESILIWFLGLMTLLFFVPKIIYRFMKIPSPLVEIIIGVLFSIFYSDVYFLQEIMQILGTLGIITLFVSAGMEVDTPFVFKNKKFFIENSLRHLFVFLIVGLALHHFFQFSWIIAALVSLALTTPSASYILSTAAGENKLLKSWLAHKALLGEIISLFLLIVLLQIGSLHLLLVLGALITLLLFLPLLFKKLYEHLFSKIVGSEFSFLFVIALISAFITEFLGVHFIIGAFIAGFVARRFVAETVKDKRFKQVTKMKGFALISSFQFFAATFIPFFFFRVGLEIKKDYFTATILLTSLALSLLVGSILFFSFFLHRHWRVREPIGVSFRTSLRLLPTLVFTFVIAEILKKNYGISEELYAILLLYGVFTALLTLLAQIIMGSPPKKSKISKVIID
jgi:Kef-type K+ transport system membrane component KefB